MADTTTTDYERGYRDGVTAASSKIAAFFDSQRAKDAGAISAMAGAHAMMHGLMLQVLAPLQDEVRMLKPEIANG